MSLFYNFATVSRGLLSRHQNLVEFDLASRESKDLLYAIYFTVTSSLFAYLISKDKWLIQAVYFFRFCRVDYHVRRPSDNSIQRH